MPTTARVVRQTRTRRPSPARRRGLRAIRQHLLPLRRLRHLRRQPSSATSSCMTPASAHPPTSGFTQVMTIWATVPLLAQRILPHARISFGAPREMEIPSAMPNTLPIPRRRIAIAGKALTATPSTSTGSSPLGVQRRRRQVLISSL